MVYLDFNASAPMVEGVEEAVAGTLGMVGNPSSVHGEGRAARKIVEEARDDVAALVGAKPENVIFTSGATEANNLALLGAGRKHVIVSATEHVSVLAHAPAANHLSVDGDGVIDLDQLPEFLKRRGRNSIVSIMAANNETGVIQPVGVAARRAHESNALFHCDAVQAVGRIPFDLTRLDIDMASLSAHKIGGPKGVGALVLADGIEIAPAILGGGQERRRRGGTENVPGIAGFAVAARTAAAARLSIGRVANLLGILERRAEAVVPGVVILGEAVPRIANTTCLALPGVDAETQVMALDLAGVSVSAGSACSSGKVGESHVLKAMGIEESIARSAIRVSLGHETSMDDVTQFLEAWQALAKRAA